MQPSVLGWRPYVQTWLTKFPEFFSHTKNYIYAMFDKHVDDGLIFVDQHRALENADDERRTHAPLVARTERGPGTRRRNFSSGCRTAVKNRARTKEKATMRTKIWKVGMMGVFNGLPRMKSQDGNVRSF